MEILSTIFVYSILYVIIIMLLRLIIFTLITVILNIDSKKYSLKIKLPIPKKYKTKVNPIYEISFSYLSDYYYIHKHSLGYEENESLGFFSFILIPYPIKIETYQYNQEEGLFFGDEKFVDNFQGSVEVFYENKMRIKREKFELELQKENKLQNKLNTLNKTFKENYE